MILLSQDHETDSAKSYSFYIDGMMKFEIFKDYKGAIIDFTNAIRLGESSSSVFSDDVMAKIIIRDYYKNRAFAFYKLEKYNHAADDFDSYINLMNEYWSANAIDYFRRGNCFFKLEQYRKAIKDYNEGLNIEINDDYIANRALSYYGLEDYKNAILDFTVVINNGQTQFYEWRGKSYIYTNKYHSAITDFNSFLNIKEDPEIIHFKGFAYAMLNSSNLACDNFKQACSLGYSLSCDLSKQVDGVCFPKRIIQKRPSQKRPSQIETNTIKSNNNGKIQLPIIPEGNMKFINVTVGNKKYKYLIDTGASDMIINSDMENYLLQNGYLRLSHYKDSRIYEIANGQRIELKIAILPYIKIGNYKFNDIEIAIGGKSSSLLLGMSFLNRFDWKFNSNNIELISK